MNAERCLQRSVLAISRWVGKRVAAWSLMTQGSYAEYYKVPADWTVEIPDEVDFAIGSANCSDC